MDPDGKKFGGVFLQEATSCFNIRDTLFTQCRRRYRNQKRRWDAVGSTYSTSLSRDTSSHIQPLDLDILKDAFQLKETAPIDLPSAEKGIPTIAGKSKSESKDKEKKHKKHKDRDKDKARSVRSTGIVIKIEAKTKKRTKRKIKAGIMIQVPIPLRNAMKRKGSMMEMMILTICINTKEVSIKAQKLMNWEQ